MKKTIKEYIKLMIHKDNIVTFQENIVVLYDDGYSKYNVIILEIRCKDKLFSAKKEKDNNYTMQNLYINKICDEDLISSLKEVYPEWII